MMKIGKVSRDTILPAIASAVQACDKSQIAIWETLLLEVGDGILTVTGAGKDMEIAASVDISAAELTDGTACIPGKKLYDILKCIAPSTALSLSVSEGKATLQAGRSRFTLSALPPTNFPKVATNRSKATIHIDPAEMKNHLDRVKHAAAKRDVRHYLNGVLITTGDGCMRYVASDGHRLAYSEQTDLKDANKDSSSIIPQGSVSTIVSWLGSNESKVKLSISDNHISLTRPGSKIVAKLVDGKFPDFEKLIPKGYPNVATLSISDLKHAVSRALILANEQHKCVVAHLNPDDVKVCGTNPANEEADDMIAADYDGEPLTLGLNGEYLRDAIGAIPGTEVAIAALNSDSSILITSPTCTTTKQVVMTMRL